VGEQGEGGWGGTRASRSTQRCREQQRKPYDAVLLPALQLLNALLPEVVARPLKRQQACLGCVRSILLTMPHTAHGTQVPATLKVYRLCIEGLWKGRHEVVWRVQAKPLRHTCRTLSLASVTSYWRRVASSRCSRALSIFVFWTTSFFTVRRSTRVLRASFCSRSSRF
jgi:hypothetical protein